MTLQQRVEFERLLALHAAATWSLIEADADSREARAVNAHNTRCDLITWVEQNVERGLEPIHDTSGGN